MSSIYIAKDAHFTGLGDRAYESEVFRVENGCHTPIAKLFGTTAADAKANSMAFARLLMNKEISLPAIQTVDKITIEIEQQVISSPSEDSIATDILDYSLRILCKVNDNEICDLTHKVLPGKVEAISPIDAALGLRAFVFRNYLGQ